MLLMHPNISELSGNVYTQTRGNSGAVLFFVLNDKDQTFLKSSSILGRHVV